MLSSSCDSLERTSVRKRNSAGSRVFDHASMRYTKGYRLMTVGWTDGNAHFLPVNSLQPQNPDNLIGTGACARMVDPWLVDRGTGTDEGSMLWLSCSARKRKEVMSGLYCLTAGFNPAGAYRRRKHLDWTLLPRSGKYVSAMNMMAGSFPSTSLWYLARPQSTNVISPFCKRHGWQSLNKIVCVRNKKNKRD